MTINRPENYENELVDYIFNEIYKNINCNLKDTMMSYSERNFLNGVIRQLKPKKILEIGVSEGIGSSIILNSIKDIDNSFLYSIDYNENLYYDNNFKTGYIVNDYFKELHGKWKLYLGATSSRFIDDIGKDIDLCVLDTKHSNPGEFLDFLMVLPYLKKGGYLIIHDIALHSIRKNEEFATCGTLFAAIKGKKILPHYDNYNICNNIGLIILDNDVMEYLFDYFYLLSLKWRYLPTSDDIVDIKNIFEKNYGKEYTEMFLSIYSFQKEQFDYKNKNHFNIFSSIKKMFNL